MYELGLVPVVHVVPGEGAVNPRTRVPARAGPPYTRARRPGMPARQRRTPEALSRDATPPEKLDKNSDYGDNKERQENPSQENHVQDVDTEHAEVRIPTPLNSPG